MQKLSQKWVKISPIRDSHLFLFIMRNSGSFYKEFNATKYKNELGTLHNSKLYVLYEKRKKT